VQASELDAEGFDAEEYVRRVLSTEDLEGVLRIEAGLINGIFVLHFLTFMDEFVVLKVEREDGDAEAEERCLSGRPCWLMSASMGNE
jgi:hypothetical protein